MDDRDIAIISAVVAQQNIFLHQLIMLINDDDDEDFNFDEDEMLDWVTAIKTQKPGRLWSYKRFGTFWEKDVPENNEAFFKESFRMERHCFDILVNRLEVLRKKDTNCRAAIPLEKRIAIALYTLGSSSEYRTVGRLFGVAPNSVCNILHEFCRALIHEFSNEYKNNSAIIMSCCILHNILNMHNSAINENWELATNEQREQPDTSNTSADFNQPAEQIRSAIAKYCVDRNEN